MAVSTKSAVINTCNDGNTDWMICRSTSKNAYTGWNKNPNRTKSNSVYFRFAVKLYSFILWLLNSSHVQRPGRLMLISGVISFRSSSWMSQTTTENRRLLHHHRLALFFLPHILFSRCNVSGKESNSFTFLFDVSNKMMGTILPSMMCFPHINEFSLANCKRLLRL